MLRLFKDLGLLRILLITAALLVIVLTPKPGTEAARSGWEMIPTLVAPAIAPLVFMVLMFDFMMCRVRMTDDHAKSKFRRISYIELGVAALLFLVWLPFFLAIGK